MYNTDYEPLQIHACNNDDDDDLFVPFTGPCELRCAVGLPSPLLDDQDL
jgi:hypothetical protein